MFNFVCNTSAEGNGLIAAAAILLDDDGVAAGSVMFMSDASEYVGYVVTLPLLNGAHRQDSTFLWLRHRHQTMRMRATHSYGLMHQGQCLASWQKTR